VPKVWLDRGPLFVRRAHYTSASRTCKGAPYEGETKGVACKGAWPCEDMLEAPYEARSYCNTLEKRVKFLSGEENV
jgi:hypothetical protein